jgi:pentatricopeptide repeat protein
VEGESVMIVEQIESNFDKVAAGMVEEGLQNIKELLNHPDMTDDLRFEVAQNFYQYGFLAEAIGIIQRLTEFYPDETELLLFLAELYMENSQEEEALALLVSVPSDQGDDYIRAILLAAELYITEGLFEVAEYKIRQALEHYPDEKIVHTALGEVFYQQEKYSLAITSYEKGNVISTYSKLADCYAHVGRFEDALDYYQKAVTTEAENPDILFGAGFVAYQLEKWEMAASKFTELLDRDPYYTSVYPLVVDTYSKLGQEEEVVKYIELGLKYDQTNPHLFFLQGEYFYKKGDVENAMNTFKQSLDLDETYVLSIEKLVEMARTQEDWKSSLKYLDRLLEITPERSDIHTQIGMVYEEMEEWNKAEKSYKAAIAIDEHDTVAMNRLGYVVRDEGRLEEALSLWKKSMRINPDQWEIEELLQRYE